MRIVKWTSKRVLTTLESFFTLDRHRISLFGFYHIPENTTYNRSEAFLNAILREDGSTELFLTDSDDTDWRLDEGKSYDFYFSLVQSILVLNFENQPIGEACPVTGDLSWSYV